MYSFLNVTIDLQHPSPFACSVEMLTQSLKVLIQSHVTEKL